MLAARRQQAVGVVDYKVVGLCCAEGRGFNREAILKAVSVLNTGVRDNCITSLFVTICVFLYGTL